MTIIKNSQQICQQAASFGNAKLEKPKQRLQLSEISFLNIPEEKKPKACLCDGELPDLTALQTVSCNSSSRSLQDIHFEALKCFTKGQYEKVIPLCKAAVEELEQTCGHYHPNVATMLTILALVYRDQGRNKESVDLLYEAMAIRKKTLERRHPAMVSTFSALAEVNGKCGNWQEAERFCRKVLDIRERTLGSNHPDVAKQFYNLALLCQKQRKYDLGVAYHVRALQIYQTVLGPDSMTVVTIRNSLARCYQKQRKFNDAETVYKKELTRIHEIKFGPIDDSNKPIWQIAEERENDRTKPRDNTPYSIYGSWHRIDLVNTLTVWTTLERLAKLYNKQGKMEASRILENCAKRMEATNVTFVAEPRPRKSKKNHKNKNYNLPVINRLRREKQYK
ncbi:kinesin light chain-like [Sabethes cyaneus]|uniref:kinesin light chain-like n=1 Tax=Sabethes cyaneus TaxID=53552 RepID=UPI00237D5B42|nr:kinesin light chain-like [Sabethes cyaneus]